MTDSRSVDNESDMFDTNLVRPTIDASWLSSPDVHATRSLLDYTRGVIRGLPEFGAVAAPTHVMSIRAAFEEICAPYAYRPALNLLSTLREIEALPHGYWVPTPHRLVSVGDTYIFIGALPTDELPFPSYVNVGLARIVDVSGGEILPIQTIATWAEIEIAAPTQVMKSLERHHFADPRPTIVTDGAEYLTIQGPRNFPVWTTVPSKISATTNIAVCRERGKYGSRYFIGSIEFGRLTHESPLLRRPADLLPALASARGTPLIAVLRHATEVTEVILPRPTPASIRRIFALVARTRGASRSDLRAVIPTEFAPAISASLISLGYVLESR